MSWLTDKDFGAFNLDLIDEIKGDDSMFSPQYAIIFNRNNSGRKSAWLFDNKVERDETLDVIYHKLDKER